MRNIELKARLADLDAAREVARSIATNELGIQEQTDTYFRCPKGRLKLRQIEHALPQLVWYARPDEEGPAASDYRLVPVTNPETLKAALDSAYGIWCVVRKRREIYLYHNVRIHLDEVEGLGTFLEFEAVLSRDVDDERGQSQVADLRERFSISDTDLLAVSYSDLLAKS
jgi:predicted adenylyl cyclase CyaB